MSRNVIIGLAVLVLVALAWIAIDSMNDGTEVADAPLDAPLTTTETETDEVAVVPETTDEPTANAEEAVADLDTAPIVEEQIVGEDAEVVELEPVEEAGTELGEGVASLAEEGETAVETAAEETGDALAGAAAEVGEAAEAVGDTAAGAGTELAGALDAPEAALVETDEAADAADGGAVVPTIDADGVSDRQPDAGADTIVADDAATDAETTTATIVASDEPLVEERSDLTTQTVEIGSVVDDTAAVEAPDEIATLLTPGTFAVEPILAYIEGSDLEDVQKASLRETVEAAGDDPAQVDAAIEELRTTFEIE